MAARGNATIPVRVAPALAPLSFQLDWAFNAQFAGLLIAQAKGLFETAGLQVEIRAWNDGLNVIDAVTSGTADMACAEQNLIISAQAAGAPIRAVATMLQSSPYGLMTMPGVPLEDLTDLAGARVGVHVDGVKVMELIKGVNGLTDMEIVEIPYTSKFARVVSGEFAAVQCYVINEPMGVSAAYGVEPTVLKLSEFGFLSTAQTIVASERLLRDRPEAVRAFLAATFEGWAWALDNKPQSASIIVDQFVPVGSPYKDVVYQTRMLELIEPYVRGAGSTLGVIDAALWHKASEQMHAYGIVQSLPDKSKSLAFGLMG